MAKKNFIQKNEKSMISKALMLIFLFILFSLVVPAIGTPAGSPTYWISIVDFFTAVRDHVSQFWMFYTLGGAALFAFLRNPKK